MREMRNIYSKSESEYLMGKGNLIDPGIDGRIIFK
jgi:hypothetical protein